MTCKEISQVGRVYAVIKSNNTLECALVKTRKKKRDLTFYVYVKYLARSDFERVST